MIDENYILHILCDIESTHLNTRKKLDFDVKDKKMAIYIIQGGIISILYSVLLMRGKGLVTQINQQWRMLVESLDLIMFFIEINENSRQIKSWFNGNVVNREPGNKGNLTLEERSKIMCMNPNTIDFLDKNIKKMSNELSVFMHPTFKALRANLRKSSYIFDYRFFNTPHLTLDNNDFSERFLIPCIQSIMLPAKILSIDNITFTRFRNYINEINGIINLLN